MAQTLLTLTRLRNNVTWALTGGSVSSELDQDDIINEVGQAFYGAERWNFRMRPPVTLGVIAGESYIDLPIDFGEPVSVQMSNTLNYGVTLTSIHEIQNLRSTTVTVTSNYYWAAMVQPRQRSRTEAPPPPRLELWPTPGSTDADILTIVYRARWTPLYNTDDVADVPDFAHGAFLMFLRRYVGGLSERLLDPKGGLEVMIDNLKKSTVWRDAVNADGLWQNNYGPIMNGAIEMTYPRLSQFSAAASSSNPS